MVDDVRRANQILGKAVIEKVEVDGGHSVFMIGKNVSFIYDTILPNLNKYKTP
jgi:hypothetical protein